LIVQGDNEAPAMVIIAADCDAEEIPQKTCYRWWSQMRRSQSPRRNRPFQVAKPKEKERKAA